MIYFAAISAALGVQMLGRVHQMTAAVLAFLLGGLLGHILRLDQQVGAWAGKCQSGGRSDATHGILVAFTLFCVSTAGILGALELGFSGDTTLLTTKAVMDFLSALFFAASCGWTLAVISVPLGAILAIFYLLSTLIAPYLTDAVIGNFSACGGLIQLVNALRIAKLKDIGVMATLPTTLEPTKGTIRRMARECGKKVELIDCSLTNFVDGCKMYHTQRRGISSQTPQEVRHAAGKQ